MRVLPATSGSTAPRPQKPTPSDPDTAGPARETAASRPGWEAPTAISVYPPRKNMTTRRTSTPIRRATRA